MKLAEYEAEERIFIDANIIGMLDWRATHDSYYDDRCGV